MDEFTRVTRLYCEDVEYEADEEDKNEKYCHIYDEGSDIEFLVGIYSEIKIDSEGSCKNAIYSTRGKSDEGFLYEDIVFDKRYDVTCIGDEGNSLNCTCKTFLLSLEDFLEEFLEEFNE